MMKTITVKTSARMELKDITRDIEKVVKENKVKNGACTLYVPHLKPLDLLIQSR